MPHFLYRHFDESGSLLYIGISIDALVRQGGHESRSGWWRDIRRIEIEVYANKTEAARAEVELIKKLRPRWNTQHAPVKPIDVPIAESRKGAELLRRLRARTGGKVETGFADRVAAAVAELRERSKPSSD
jgi:excinuclease UvrABC nuclease subunit